MAFGSTFGFGRADMLGTPADDFDAQQALREQERRQEQLEREQALKEAEAAQKAALNKRVKWGENTKGQKMGIILGALSAGLAGYADAGAGLEMVRMQAEARSKKRDAESRAAQDAVSRAQAALDKGKDRQISQESLDVSRRGQRDSKAHNDRTFKQGQREHDDQVQHWKNTAAQQLDMHEDTLDQGLKLFKISEQNKLTAADRARKDEIANKLGNLMLEGDASFAETFSTMADARENGFDSLSPESRSSLERSSSRVAEKRAEAQKKAELEREALAVSIVRERAGTILSSKEVGGTTVNTYRGSEDVPLPGAAPGAGIINPSTGQPLDPEDQAELMTTKDKASQVLALPGMDAETALGLMVSQGGIDPKIARTAIESTLPREALDFLQRRPDIDSFKIIDAFKRSPTEGWHLVNELSKTEPYESGGRNLGLLYQPGAYDG